MPTPTTVTTLNVTPLTYTPPDDHTRRVSVALASTAFLIAASLFGAGLLPTVYRVFPPGPDVSFAGLQQTWTVTMSVLITCSAAVLLAALHREKRGYREHLRRYGLVLSTEDNPVLLLSDNDRRTVQNHLGQDVVLHYGRTLLSLAHIHGARSVQADRQGQP